MALDRADQGQELVNAEATPDEGEFELAPVNARSSVSSLDTTVMTAVNGRLVMGLGMGLGMGMANHRHGVRRPSCRNLGRGRVSLN